MFVIPRLDGNVSYDVCASRATQTAQDDDGPVGGGARGGVGGEGIAGGDVGVEREGGGIPQGEDVGVKELDDVGKDKVEAVVDPFDANPTIALRRRHACLGAEEGIGD